jgi:hypothetical protein
MDNVGEMSTFIPNNKTITKKIKQQYFRNSIKFIGKILKLFISPSPPTNGELLRQEYKSKAINFRNF